MKIPILTLRHSISPSILRLRCKLNCESIRVARCRHGIRPILITKQSQFGDATSAQCPHTVGAEMPTNVYTVYAPEIVSSDRVRLRRLC